MEELVNYKDVQKNQREVLGIKQAYHKSKFGILNILPIRPTKDPADPYWFVDVVVPSKVFLTPQNLIEKKVVANP